MWNIKHRIRFIFRAGLALFGLWFLIYANYGLLDYIRLHKEIKKYELELANILEEKTEIMKLVQSISGQAIDLNLLEMQSRKVLAYGRKNEIIFFWK